MFWINYIWLAITNWRHFIFWRKIQKGEKTADYRRGAGYYLSTLALAYSGVGKIEEYEMKSGKIGLYELIDYETFSDPSDMIKESYWHFIGYKQEKPIKDCTFIEFITKYT